MVLEVQDLRFECRGGRGLGRQGDLEGGGERPAPAASPFLGAAPVHVSNLVASF